MIIRRPGCGPVVFLASITDTALAVMDAKGAGAWPWLEWAKDYDENHVWNDRGATGVFARPKIKQKPYDTLRQLTSEDAVSLLRFWDGASAYYSQGTEEMQAISAAVFARLVALRDLDMNKGRVLWR